MRVDPNNKVVQLCAAGIQVEMEGHHAEAQYLYMQAWDLRTNDYESCIVAHYMARVQTEPDAILHWNLEALRYADNVGDESVAAFYPSLYLNIGKAFEDKGDIAEAREYYNLGSVRCATLPDDALGNMTRDALRRGLKRTE